MAAEQTAIAERIGAVIGGIHGPYAAWIKRPKLAEGMFNTLIALRDLAVLPRRVRMVATITVIRHWGADYAWGVNKPLALDAGVPASVVEAIEARRTPEFSDDKDQLGWQVAVDLLNNRRLSDDTFNKAASALGDDALVELIAAVGYFSAVALTVVAYEIKARSHS
jgi:4-carboxymuconolactone decarboxylase